MIRFACPSCQKSLAAPEERAGAKTICPQCRQELAVPSAALPIDSAPPVAARGRGVSPKLMLLAGGLGLVALASAALGVAIVMSLATGPEVAGKSPTTSGAGQSAPASQAAGTQPRSSVPSTKPVPDSRRPTTTPTQATQTLPPGGSQQAPVQTSPTDKPRLVLDPEGHTGPVKRVFLTPDNKRAITVSLDKTVRIWDVATGESLHVVRLPIAPDDSGMLEAASLSTDGKLLVVAGLGAEKAGQPRPIYFLAPDVPQIVRVLPGPATHVREVKLSPDGKLLAVGSDDNLVRVYEVNTGRLAYELSGHSKAVVALAFAPDGQRLLSASLDQSGRLWSLTTRKQENLFHFNVAVTARPGESPIEALVRTGQISSRPIQISSLTWSPDSRTIAMGGTNGFVQTYDPAGKGDGRPAPPLKTFSISFQGADESGISSIAFTPDGRALLVTGAVSRQGAGSAGILDLESGKFRQAFPGHGQHTVLAGNLSVDGQLAISSGAGDSETCIWRTSNGQLVQEFRGRGKPVNSLSWSKDGKTIAWGDVAHMSAAVAPLKESLHLETLEYGDASNRDMYASPVKPQPRVRDFNGTYKLHLQPSQLVRGIPISPVGSALKDHLYFRPEHVDDLFHQATFVSDKHVAIAANSGIYLVDVTDDDGRGSRPSKLVGDALVATKLMKLVRKFRGHTGAVTFVTPSPDGRHFISGSLDQTVRLWDPEQEEPLLSILATGSDWIAWTPQGYYAASPGGERLMGWQVNNGPQAIATYHPAAQFRQSLYRPDVIKRILAAGSVAKAVALADQERQKPGALVNVDQVRPPLAAITYPPGPSGHRISGTSLEVKAVARSVGSHPVAALRLLVDGRPYGGADGRRVISAPRLGEVTATWKVELAPGKHVLTVQAESAVSKGLSPFVEVTNTSGAAEQPNLYVLAVGINDYPGELRLKYAAPDADAITKALSDKGARVFRNVEVKVIKDRDATRQGIERGLGWLKEKMTARDVGMLFFSGHGDRSGNNFYLIPVDINPADVPGSCVSGEFLKQTLGSIPGRVIAVLDACHSGAAIDAQRRPADADDLIRELASDDYGIVVMSSSLSKEFSLESSSVKQGFYTLALVEGLSGRADRNRDGLVHLGELDRYTNTRVTELSAGKQHPIMNRPPSIHSFPLAGN